LVLLLVLHAFHPGRDVIREALQVIPSQGSHLLGFENLQAMFSHSNIRVVLNFFFQLSEEGFVVLVIIKIASKSPGGIGLYKTTSK